MPYVVAYALPCLMSWVSRALRNLPHRSSIEFRCHAIAKIYPIDRCRVRITPIATALLRRSNDAMGRKW